MAGHKIRGLPEIKLDDLRKAGWGRCAWRNCIGIMALSEVEKWLLAARRAEMVGLYWREPNMPRRVRRHLRAEVCRLLGQPARLHRGWRGEWWRGPVLGTVLRWARTDYCRSAGIRRPAGNSRGAASDYNRADNHSRKEQR